MAGPRAVHRAVPWVGLIVSALVVTVAFVLPPHFGWEVASRFARRASPDDVPPLHGLWDPKLFGPGTLPAVAIAALACWYAVDLARTLPWRRLLAASYAASLAWLLSLAFVVGPKGISGVLGKPSEYLESARAVHNLPQLLDTYINRIPYPAADHWAIHVAGHPPAMLLFFVGLVRVGLGGDFTAGLVVTLLAASTAVAALVTLRALDAEVWARSAAPFLVFTPAAVFMAVSADAVIAVVVAWGLACLALASHRLWWAVPAGLLLGISVLMSYGMPLMALVALAVVVAGRSWRPLPVAAAAALAVVLLFAVMGFAWWEAYPVLRERYYAGIASDRPQAYWWFGNLACLVITVGPLLFPALLAAGATAVSRARASARVVLLLVGSTAAVVALADASGMSKGEVERIWLPFVPWLTLSVALLPERWRRWGLVLQLGTALLVQHLFYTSW